MARNTGRRFNLHVARQWRKRYLDDNETLMSIARSVSPPISDAMVYYHIRKFGVLPKKKRGPAAKPPARRVEAIEQADPHEIRKADARRIISPSAFNERYMQQRPKQPTEKSMFGEPDRTAMMAGRARIPRRVERMQGVEA